MRRVGQGQDQRRARRPARSLSISVISVTVSKPVQAVRLAPVPWTAARLREQGCRGCGILVLAVYQQLLKGGSWQLRMCSRCASGENALEAAWLPDAAR